MRERPLFSTLKRPAEVQISDQITTPKLHRLTMKTSELSSPASPSAAQCKQMPQKPHFRPAKDDTKPILRDPILRSDPIETEEAVLRPPPFQPPASESNIPSKMG